MNTSILRSTDAEYPVRLRERLGGDAPKTLNCLGDLALLSRPKTGLFCSVSTPNRVEASPGLLHWCANGKYPRDR